MLITLSRWSVRLEILDSSSILVTVKKTALLGRNYFWINDNAWFEFPVDY